jgi:hypothetical protein
MNMGFFSELGKGEELFEIPSPAKATHVLFVYGYITGTLNTTNEISNTFQQREFPPSGFACHMGL